jgi:hypothetical protein
MKKTLIFILSAFIIFAVACKPLPPGQVKKSKGTPPGLIKKGGIPPGQQKKKRN